MLLPLFTPPPPFTPPPLPLPSPFPFARFPLPPQALHPARETRNHVEGAEEVWLLQQPSSAGGSVSAKVRTYIYVQPSLSVCACGKVRTVQYMHMYLCINCMHIHTYALTYIHGLVQLSLCVPVLWVGA